MNVNLGQSVLDNVTLQALAAVWIRFEGVDDPSRSDGVSRNKVMSPMFAPMSTKIPPGRRIFATPTADRDYRTARRSRRSARPDRPSLARPNMGSTYSACGPGVCWASPVSRSPRQRAPSPFPTPAVRARDDRTSGRSAARTNTLPSMATPPGPRIRSWHEHRKGFLNPFALDITLRTSGRCGLVIIAAAVGFQNRGTLS